ncbi:hypothetical protein [Nocardia otitidiscaviarum]|uniref:hypothetical protein n=1 Tax=Nocardia otitidiscaviarum TaxID=1823 RepID=UPI0018932FF8|nr:hypothetical protein [Nocardia otitidiscaviarum]MBF6177441.1 hypothetical protein [Nocardia otitidiscaviarum]
MEITLLEEAYPGQMTAVRSRSGDWTAVWKGESTARKGDTYSIELQIEGFSLGATAGTESESVGIKTSGDRTIVCGLVSVIYDDGVLALDLAPGIVLIDPVIPPDVQIGQRIWVSPHTLAIFPTTT